MKREKRRKKKESEYDNNERQGRKMFLRASATRTLSIGLGSKNKTAGDQPPAGISWMRTLTSAAVVVI